MKTKEELNALKEEVEALNKKLAELTDEELEQVTGGNGSIQEVIGEWGIQEVIGEWGIHVKLKEDKFKENLVQDTGGVVPDGEGEKHGYNVAFFPGLSGFP